MNALPAVAETGSAELLARARSGEREAFTELVERHHAELVRIAYAVTGDLEAARDSAQIAWIKAWQKLPTVREPERLRPWLIAIAANEARQHLRANKRRRVREITPLMPESEAGSIDTGLPSADQMDLSAVLVRLDPSDRQLLAMRYLAGLTAEEIGLAIGISASGIRTRLSRLISRLRVELDND